MLGLHLGFRLSAMRKFPNCDFQYNTVGNDDTSHHNGLEDSFFLCLMPLSPSHVSVK